MTLEKYDVSIWHFVTCLAFEQMPKNVSNCMGAPRWTPLLLDFVAHNRVSTICHKSVKQRTLSLTLDMLNHEMINIGSTLHSSSGRIKLV